MSIEPTHYCEGQLVRHNLHGFIVLDDQLYGDRWSAHTKRIGKPGDLVVSEEHILESVSEAQYRRALNRAERIKRY